MPDRIGPFEIARALGRGGMGAVWLAQDAQLKPPTLIIVGEVVKLHDKLKWFDPAGTPDVGSWKQDKPGK